MDNSTADVHPVIPSGSAASCISDMAVSSTSLASSGHFPFTPSEMSGLGVDTSPLDTAFTSDVASTVGLQLGPDAGAGNPRDSLTSLAQLPYTFSLSDLTADLANMGGKLAPSSFLLVVCQLLGKSLHYFHVVSSLLCFHHWLALLFLSLGW